MAPQSVPGIENAGRGGRKRPVQPVVPVIPFVAPRSGSHKSKTDSKPNGTKSTQSTTSSTSVTESFPSQESPETPRERNGRETPGSSIIAETQTEQDAHISDEPIPTETKPSTLLSEATNGINIEDDLISIAAPTKSASSPTKTTKPSNNSPTVTIASLTDESTSVTNYGDSSVASEDVGVFDGPATSVNGTTQNGRYIETRGESEKTPKILAQEIALSEVAEHTSTKRSSQRRSEVAPEVLSNGHQRNYSTYASSNHHVNGSMGSLPPLLPPVHEHLMYLANSKHLCDTIIQVNQPGQHLQPSLHYAHAAFLVRSPKLAKAMPDFDPIAQSRFMNFYPPRNIQPHAFEAALRFLYSDHILSADGLLPRDITLDKAARAQYLDYIISYWVSGIELGLMPIQSRARELLQELLAWDLVELVIKEAYGLRSVVTSPEKSADTELIRLSHALVQTALTFIAENLNLSQFTLDVESNISALNGRFSRLEIGRGTSNPALAAMVFGSMPAHQSTQASITTIASAVLLNLDFGDIKALESELFKWHEAEAVRVLSDVVEEREKRRAHAVGNRMIPNKQRLSNSMIWDEAGWREYVSDGRLYRERVDYLLPTKSR